MAMSISGSSSASSVMEGCWVVEGSGAEVGLGLGLGEAIVAKDRSAVRVMQYSRCQDVLGVGVWGC